MKNEILKAEEKVNDLTIKYTKHIKDLIFEFKEKMNSLLLKYSYYKSETMSETKMKLNKVLSEEERVDFLWILSDTLNYIRSFLYLNENKEDIENLTNLWKTLKESELITQKKRLEVEMLIAVILLRMGIKSKLYKLFDIIDKKILYEIYMKFDVAYDDNTLYNVLWREWLGSTYSKRIDENTNALMEKVNGIIEGFLFVGISMIISKNTLSQVIKPLYSYYSNLTNTESHYVFNVINRDIMLLIGYRQVRLIATLDERTSKICRSKHRKIVDLEYAQIGVDLPPFHPNCRTVYAPVTENGEFYGNNGTIKNKK